MILQLLAMWSVVALAVVWFFTDEARRRDATLNAQALAYARTPARRPTPNIIDQTPPPKYRRPVLSQADLAAIARLKRGSVQR